MSADSIVAFIMLGCIFLFAIGIAMSQLFDRYCAWADKRDAVKASRTTAAVSATSASVDAGTSRLKFAVEPVSSRQMNVSAAVGRSFHTSRPEAEAEGTRKLACGSDDGMVVLTQNALQAQLDDANRDGMVRAFAAIYRGGYLAPGKVSAAKQALFGVSGGRKLQGLNAAIDAVVVPVPPPEPPQMTPLAQRAVPNGLRFAGAALDEQDEG